MKLSTFAIIGLAAAAAPAAQAVGIITLVNSAGGIQSLNTQDSASPFISTGVPLTGVASGSRLVGIDFRPATNQLFGLSFNNLNSDSAVYTINTTTGVATLVGSGFTTQLTGASFGFDFNPVIDRIRIVADSDQNIVANPNTGDANVAATTPVFYVGGDPNVGADPNIVHSAYTNSFLGTGATQLYGIDSTLNILVTQANNAGTLATVGDLGVDATDVGGFDIFFGDNTGYAAFTDVTGSALLYSINLGSGTATPLGALNGAVTGLAVVPEPSSLALIGLGALGFLSRRRRA